METSRETIDELLEESERKRWAKYSGDRFVATGEGCTFGRHEPTPEDIEEAEKHFAEMEKKHGIKYKPWSPED